MLNCGSSQDLYFDIWQYIYIYTWIYVYICIYIWIYVYTYEYIYIICIVVPHLIWGILFDSTKILPRSPVCFADLIPVFLGEFVFLHPSLPAFLPRNHLLLSEQYPTRVECRNSFSKKDHGSVLEHFIFCHSGNFDIFENDQQRFFNGGDPC